MTPIERAARAVEEVMEREGVLAHVRWEPGFDTDEIARAVIGAIRDHFEDLADAQQGASEAAESEQAAIAVGRTHTMIDALEELLDKAP